MSRKARIKDDFGIFYITQHCSGTRSLFECDADRNRFIQIINKAQLKFHFHLYAYCIVSKDQYHLVLDVNGGDLSKIMKSINIAYAMYAKCNNKLYRDRYKSILLETQKDLVEAIATIHNSFIKDSTLNDYCTYNYFAPLPIKKVECPNCLRSLEEAKLKLQEITQLDYKTINELNQDKKYRNKLIKKFRQNSTLSLKELGILFGGLSESTICKILNQ